MTSTQTLTCEIRKRDGRVVPFDARRIEAAVARAFAAEAELPAGTPLDEAAAEEVRRLTEEIARQLGPADGSAAELGVEQIQDRVELTLMRRGHYRVARRYIVYRAERAKRRALQSPPAEAAPEKTRPAVVLDDGTRVPFDAQRIRRRLAEACREVPLDGVLDELFEDVLRSVFDGITCREIERAMVLAARSRIERDPGFDTIAARLMLHGIYREAIGTSHPGDAAARYAAGFEHAVIDGIAGGRLTPELRQFDLPWLAQALQPARDHLFRYLGLQVLYDRYLLHVSDRRIETPQFFWMRVAMGLALAETSDREARAIEFYEVLSTLRFTSATPTLFNAATCHPQLSSCYLLTVDDDLEHIFHTVADNARLSKWAGGLGNDWTNIRATGAHIAGTNGESQGVIPFLKVVNDTAVAVNQGGKRKGAVCSYLETWHLDIEEFLDLRRNTGDDRRRTHDMHTANWIPDLFMQRVRDEAAWTLFSPADVRDLHDLYGRAFAERYEEYERRAAAGEIRHVRQVPAVELWRKMLTRLYETGHAWMTWKDPANVRSPQDHAGVVHSSNLCTEILLNTSREETAVCNLGSVNLLAHVADGKLDETRLAATVRTAVRMLDNVIDINFYPTPQARQANLRHRPIGLGLMGFQDALAELGIGYASELAVEFADRSMEAISFHALSASAELAAERGAYESYPGSKWDRGLLPIDTLDLLAEQRGEAIDVDRTATLAWDEVRQRIAQCGMRNSNVLAIAPTATISTIVGVSASIEPAYKHLYAKSNLSGEFTQVNARLVDELKSRGLWDADLLEALKYHDGSLAEIDRVPDDIKTRFPTAFEVEPAWLIECAARRQKWIDQGQSLNLYLAEASGRKLHETYFLAWRAGLKTTYYLRTLAATGVEKSTVDVNRFGIQPKWMKHKSASSDVAVARGEVTAAACSLDDPDCEACQ